MQVFYSKHIQPFSPSFQYFFSLYHLSVCLYLRICSERECDRASGWHSVCVCVCVLIKNSKSNHTDGPQLKILSHTHTSDSKQHKWEQLLEPLTCSRAPELRAAAAVGPRGPWALQGRQWGELINYPTCPSPSPPHVCSPSLEFSVFRSFSAALFLWLSHLSMVVTFADLRQ